MTSLEMTPLTLLHVFISLAGILTGFVVVYGMLKSDPLKDWTLAFLVTTIATSVTGFIFFPFTQFLPSHAVGVLSLVILGFALYALYGKRLAGAWRWIYAATAIAALYFNVFVLVVQAFLKVPSLHALAPQGTEAPFVAVQGAVLLAFVAIGVIAVKRFRPAPSRGYALTT